MSLCKIVNVASAIRFMKPAHKTLQLANPCLTTSQWSCMMSSRTNPTDSIPKRGTKPMKPVTFGYSGDLITLNPLDLTQPRVPFNQSQELENAPDTVKKLFSLDFAEGEGRIEYRLEAMSHRIDEQLGPDAYREKEIALLTVRIRNLIPHCLRFRKDKLKKSRLVEIIQARKTKLKDLQKLDFERFVWLLNDLRIKYVPYPDEHSRRVTRRGLRRMEAGSKSNDLIMAKKRALCDELHKEREEFEGYKEATLAQIERDISEFNLNEDEIWKAVYHDQSAFKIKDEKVSSD